MHPRAILLDEPTANLDPEGVQQVRDAVVQAVTATGATLIVVEHRVGVWAQHMDRVIVLGADGGITHDGAPDTVLAEARREPSSTSGRVGARLCSACAADRQYCGR